MADGPGGAAPLDGVRVLALEQMQALPYGTQLLTRLGADVVKIEHPITGEAGRGSLPAMNDPLGRPVGNTFLRNNLGKRSVGIDLKEARGRELVLRLAPRFDVVCENFKAGTIERLGLGYDDVAAVHPGVVYLSVSGFGHDQGGRYREWPAYAAVLEAMGGLYEFKWSRASHPWPRRWVRSATPRHPCMRLSGCSRPCAIEIGQEKASSSTSRCTTRWSRSATRA